MDGPQDLTPAQLYANLTRLLKRTPESPRAVINLDRSKKLLVDQFYNVERAPLRKLEVPLNDLSFHEFMEQGGVNYSIPDSNDDFDLEGYLLCIDEIVSSMYEPGVAPLKPVNRVINDIVYNVTPRKEDIKEDLHESNSKNISVLTEYVRQLKDQTETLTRHMQERMKETSSELRERLKVNTGLLESLKRDLTVLEKRLNVQRVAITNAKLELKSLHDKLVVAEEVGRRIKHYTMVSRKKRFRYRVLLSVILLFALYFFANNRQCNTIISYMWSYCPFLSTLRLST